MKKEFIESICAINGKIQHLEYHQKRVEETFTCFFNSNAFHLIELLEPLKINQKRKVKIRIEYSKDVNKIELNSYSPKRHSDFRIIKMDDFDYSFKYKDRSFFNQYKTFEPIFVQNDLITDARYANLIFYKNGTWFTPNTFLLNGTKRQFLLDTNQIQTKEISIHNLHEFEKFGLINAMLNIGENTYPIDLIK